MHLVDSKGLYLFVFFLINTIDNFFHPWLLEELAAHFDVFFADVVLLVLWKRWYSFDFTTECISDDLRTKLAA
jgi:hypothetical protein